MHRGCETRNRPSDTAAARVSAARLRVGRIVYCATSDYQLLQRPYILYLLAAVSANGTVAS